VLDRHEARWEDINKTCFKIRWFMRSVFIWLNIVTLVSFREHGNEISGCKKGGQFIDYVNHD